jgi:ATP-binding cassette subfamily B protein
MMVLAAALALLEPWPLALMVDSVLSDKPLPGVLERLVPASTGARIVLITCLGLCITLAVRGVGVLSDYVNTKLDMRMVLDFRSYLFQHVQRLSFAFHDERRTGEFMGRINQQASSVGKVIVGAFPLITAALTLVGMVVIAVRLNPLVALLSLSVVPFIYYSTGYYGTRIGPHVREVKIMELRSLHIVHEAVQMLRVIVSFNREDDEYAKFRAQGEAAVDARVKLTMRQSLFSMSVTLVTGVGTAAVLGVGAAQVAAGKLEVGQLLVLISYIAAVYKPLQTISVTMNTLQENLISFQLALELLETQPDVVERPHARRLERPARGEVEFDNVCFTYPGRDHTLSNISFRVAPGQSIAIVGATGAGKSTLVSLLPRFYDPSAGAVLLDGTDVRDLTLGSLRSQMSIVLQEPLLFTGSIRDNICYGRPDASRAEVIAAAEAANVHDFVRRLPKRYGTRLGERGAMLSGGERQRLCIARAFLRDAPILILDEPTSSIDSRTEAVILEALERLMEGRTTFVIAHRLSTIRNVDKILVLDDGALVEHGTHAELYERDGMYRALCDAQRSTANGSRSIR